MKVVMGQLNTWVGDLQGNIDKVIKVATEVIPQDETLLLVFPELTLTGYPPEDLLMRDSLHDQIESALQRLLWSCPRSCMSLWVIHAAWVSSCLMQRVLSTTAQLLASISSSVFQTTRYLMRSVISPRERTHALSM